jgi:hypothetical protein
LTNTRQLRYNIIRSGCGRSIVYHLKARQRYHFGGIDTHGFVLENGQVNSGEEETLDGVVKLQSQIGLQLSRYVHRMDKHCYCVVVGVLMCCSRCVNVL